MRVTASVAAGTHTPRGLLIGAGLRRGRRRVETRGSRRVSRHDRVRLVVTPGGRGRQEGSACDGDNGAAVSAGRAGSVERVRHLSQGRARAARGSGPVVVGCSGGGARGRARAHGVMWSGRARCERGWSQGFGSTITSRERRAGSGLSSSRSAPRSAADLLAPDGLVSQALVSAVREREVRVPPSGWSRSAGFGPPGEGGCQETLLDHPSCHASAVATS